jgi:hypothetical protein
MRIDVKTTVWQTAEVIPQASNEIKAEILNKLKQGSTLAEIYNDYNDYLFPCETVHETEEQMSPSENNNYATVEVYDEEQQVIYNNGL